MNKWNLKYKPRKWQQQAFDIWKQDQIGIASVATAGGKTFFSFLCINYFLNNNKNGKVIILVPSIPLLDQWKAALQEELSVDEKDISLGGGGYKFSKPNLFNIFVYKTGSKIINSKLVENNSFIVVDECHKAGTVSIRDTLNFSYKARLGLSATPKRDYDDFFETYVEPLLGEIIYEYSYDDAKRDGVIPDFELRNIKVWATEDEENEIKKIKKKTAIKISSLKKQGVKNYFASEEIQNLIFTSSRLNKNLISRLFATTEIIKNEKFVRCIIFHESIEEIKKLKSILDPKFDCSIYHSGLSKFDREINLNKFKMGINPVLITCEALDEGLNVPDIDLAIISSGNLSKRQRIQRLGRTLRKTEYKEKALICTLYNTQEELNLLLKEEKILKSLVSVRWFESKDKAA